MVTITYAYPPLPVIDDTVLVAKIGESLDRAWQRVEEARLRVLTSVEEGAKRNALARLAEFEKAVKAYQAQIPAVAEDYIRVVHGEYAAGVMNASSILGVSSTYTLFDRQALASLASDSYGDLLRRSQDAGRTGAEFARAVRSTAAEFMPGQATGQTARQAGVDWRRALEERHRISSVVYADGSMHSIRDYTEMAARTKGRVAYNSGAVQRYADNDIRYVEVFDGADCGWTQHDDPDRAHGTIRSLEEAAEFPISHPRCRRAFGPRPDVRTKTQARKAEPLSQGEARVPILPARPTSTAADGGNRRRAAAAARRAARVG